MAQMLHAAGFPHAETQSRLGGGVTDKTWLEKPIRSSGGQHIRFVTSNHHQARPGYYYQRYVSGMPCAGIYVAAGRRACLLGVTWQLTGQACFGASGFQYAGSVGPIHLAPPDRVQWQRLGTWLASSFNLVGLFGVDAVYCDNRVIPVEVNPRYAASIEVLEWATGIPAMAWHVRACTIGELPVDAPRHPAHFSGKAVLYAMREGRLKESFWRYVAQTNAGRCWPQVADIPRRPGNIRIGQPVLTILARSTDLDAVAGKLRELATRFGEGFLEGVRREA
jgi:predicted ATP-grasp superfamily ATP-dependent carboligase